MLLRCRKACQDPAGGCLENGKCSQLHRFSFLITCTFDRCSGRTKKGQLWIRNIRAVGLILQFQMGRRRRGPRQSRPVSHFVKYFSYRCLPRFDPPVFPLPSLPLRCRKKPAAKPKVKAASKEKAKATATAKGKAKAKAGEKKPYNCTSYGEAKKACKSLCLASCL